MVDRIIKPLINHSFFLFGARGTGKTFYLRKHLESKSTLEINLLLATEHERLSFRADSLRSQVLGVGGGPQDGVY